MDEEWCLGSLEQDLFDDVFERLGEGLNFLMNGHRGDREGTVLPRSLEYRPSRPEAEDNNGTKLSDGVSRDFSFNRA